VGPTSPSTDSKCRQGQPRLPRLGPRDGERGRRESATFALKYSSRLNISLDMYDRIRRRSHSSVKCATRYMLAMTLCCATREVTTMRVGRLPQRHRVRVFKTQGMEVTAKRQYQYPTKMARLHLHRMRTSSHSHLNPLITAMPNLSKISTQIS
jgi:hypothetical protein